MTVTLTAGSWSYIPLLAPGDSAATLGNTSYVDVTFPTIPGGSTLDTSSINGDEVTFTVNNGHTLAIDGTKTPTRPAHRSRIATT